MEVTMEQIAERFDECVRTLDRLPADQSLGYMSYWPEIKYTPRELARQEVQPLRLKATPRQITRMEETLQWIHWVEPAERHLIWLRAEGETWRDIARRVGLPKTTAQRHWQGALLKIAGKLGQMPIFA